MACDLVTSYLDDTDDWHVFCFSEAKRLRNTTAGKIRALEDQALRYCKEYIRVQPNVHLVFANTLVGASIRCWSYHRGDENLKGFWEGPQTGSFEYYKDIGEERNRELLEETFRRMKSVPLGALHRGQDYSQIGASFASPAFQKPSHILRSQTPTSNTTSTYSEPVPTWGQEPEAMAVDAGGPSNTASSQPITLEDRNYIEVTLIKHGADIASNTYSFSTAKGKVEKLGSDFFEWTTNQGNVCMVYYGQKSNQYYWTWSLDPKSGYVVDKAVREKKEDNY